MLERDYDYVGAYLFATAPTDAPETPTDPSEMVPGLEEEKLSLPAEPPKPSNYRVADIQGVACWNCGHFTITGDDDNDGVPDGICNLWESQADGSYTCDRFTAHADLLRQQPQTSWTEDMAEGSRGPGVEVVEYSDDSVLNELFFAEPGAVEEDELVVKSILRTGSWQFTPTNQGMLKRTLKIVRDGVSDPKNGIISLQELVDNYNAKAVPYVTIPLSDDEKDHKNIARLNTGFVRKLFIKDEDGVSKLMAGMQFTEPDVKQKVLRGTIPDVSAGVPFGVTRKSDGKLFGAVLDHVCLTRRPFCDGLEPFGLAAADGDQSPLPMVVFAEGEDEIEEKPAEENQPPVEEPPAPAPEASTALSYREMVKAITTFIQNNLRLSTDYIVEDIRGDQATIRNRIANVTWTAKLDLTEDQEHPVRVHPADSWTLVEESEEEHRESSRPVAALTASNSSVPDDLRHAREMRELRLSQETGNRPGGSAMPGVADVKLDGIEMSDEARAAIQSVLDENARLQARTRENDVEQRIVELSDMGLKDRPGALKLYREIALADDGGPAAVMMSDDGQEKERLTAREILDRFIDAIKGEKGVVFSDQALASGNDDPPPAVPEGEKAPLADRVSAAKEAISGTSASGRK